ncbi:MAG: hypothetical protein M3122_05935 [Actinomycetota bacterium]|nr:hypothetical protein [Actinomycetota bacterium]
MRSRIGPGPGVEDDFPDAGGPPSGEDVIQIGNDVFIDCGHIFETESSGFAAGGEPDPDPEQTEELKRVCIEAGIFPPASETNSPTGVQYANTSS